MSVDAMIILIMTLLILTLLIMTIHVRLNMGDITNDDITYNWFYLQMALLITVNKKNIYEMLHLLML